MTQARDWDAPLFDLAKKYRLGLERDADGTYIAPGKTGHVYYWGPSENDGSPMFGAMYLPKGRTRGWGHRRHRLTELGAHITQSGDCEGAAVFPDNKKIIREACRLVGVRWGRRASARVLEILAEGRKQLQATKEIQNPPCQNDSSFSETGGDHRKQVGPSGNERPTHIAIYGHHRFKRQYCSKCGTYAIVQGGIIGCCGRHAKAEDPEAVKVMSGMRNKRGRPSGPAQKQILETQQNRCIYCLRPFGSVTMQEKRMVFLRIEWDHLLPFAYSLDNHEENFVAACQICNRIKGGTVFDTIDAARAYIAERRDDADTPDEASA